MLEPERGGGPAWPSTTTAPDYLVGGFPGADWVRNVRAADHAEPGLCPVFRVEPA